LLISWLGLVLGVIIFMSSTFSLFLEPIGREFGWRRSQLSLAYSLFSLTSTLALPPIGRLVDRVGAKQVIIGCTLTFVLISWLLRSVTGLTEFYALFIAAGVISGGTSTLAYFKVLVRTFGRHRGLALGIANSGTAIGTMLFPLIAYRLNEALGWRNTYAVMGTAIAAIIVPTVALGLSKTTDPDPRLTSGPGARTTAADSRATAGPNIRASSAARAAHGTNTRTDPDASATARPNIPIAAPDTRIDGTTATAGTNTSAVGTDARIIGPNIRASGAARADLDPRAAAAPDPRTAGPNTSAVGLTLPEALRTPHFWTIGLTFFAVTTGLVGYLIHLVPLLKDRGISPQTASVAASLFGSAQLLGRLGAGFALDHLGAAKVAAALWLLAALALAAVAAGVSGSALLLCTAGVGLAFGGEGDVLAFFVSRLFGQTSFGRIYSVLLMINLLGAVVGPYLFGVVFDAEGSYVPVLTATAATTALAAVLITSSFWRTE
jgi:MFS family permease